MDLTYGLIYSQRVMLKLIDSGLTREEAYDLVQPLTAKSWDEEQQFRALVESNPVITSHLNQSDIEEAFDYHYHLRNVDYIFKRLGIL